VDDQTAASTRSPGTAVVGAAVRGERGVRTDAARSATAPQVESRAAAGPLWRLHVSSLLIFSLGLVLVVGFAVGAHVSSVDDQNRLLSAQLQQVAAALEASMPQLQEPLIAAAKIASTESTTSPFVSFVSSEVGSQAPFRDVTLWRLRDGTSHLLAQIGPRPELLENGSVERGFFAGVRPSTLLTVTSVLAGPPRSYGLAEMLPGSSDGLAVYAETTLPLVFPQGSPLAGLDFALYLGRAATPANLMESSAPLATSHPQASLGVPFGTSAITIVATSTRPLGSVLSRDLPWIIGVVGMLVVLLAALASERLVRRREHTELLATHNERRYATQRDISNTLQHALLPEVNPEFPGLEIATRYVPGTRDLEIGGDWYDAIAIDEGRLFIAVGDVSGRGLHAATTMAYLRHAIRAYVIQGDGPDGVLGKLDELLDVERDECFATVLCGIIDVPAHRVTLASAGHPPPMLIDAAATRVVDLHVGPPVGAGDGTSPTPTTLVVSAQSLLVAYTDGLIERRGRTLDEGLQELRRAAEQRHPSIDATLTQLLGTLVPQGSEDDIAILGLRWLS
jgi:serine phosphatase RsbU (regulator of sigma subunit)